MESKTANSASDEVLLQRYANGAPDALSPLVARYVNLVYSTALRQVRDPHLAEDITQEVFLTFFRKAARLRAGTVLPNWLFCTTRYLAANALKTRKRRQRHEQQRAIMAQDICSSDPAAASENSTALVDEALASLGRRDREAVLLKFIEGKSHRDVALAIGVTEEAARKRVARSVERMRDFFQLRGVALPAAGLTALLTIRSVEAAPPALAEAVGRMMARNVVGTTGLSTCAVATVIGTKATVAAVCVAASLLLIGGLGYAAHLLRSQSGAGQAGRPPVVLNTPIVPVLAPAPADPARQTQSVEGTVVGADGNPRAGVEVYLATPDNRFAFYAVKQKNKPQVTQADGKFSFPRPKIPWVIVARTQDGAAQVTAKDLVKSSLVVLKPWGRIEGTLYAGDKPLPGERVFVGFFSYSNDPIMKCVINQTTAKTDATGRFAFTSVLPGTPMIAHQTSRPWVENSKWDTLEVRAGQTTKFDMGTVGRPVTGKIAVPAGWENTLRFVPDKTHSAEVAARRSDLPYMTTPPGYSKLSPAEQLRWSEEWTRSREGIEWLRLSNFEYTALQPDGSFRFDVVKPGRYSLAIHFRERDSDNPMQEDVAAGAAEFSIPALPVGQRFAGEPVNVGTVALKPAPRVMVGAPAPALRVQTLDGGVLSLEDYKGKFLVVQFRSERMQHEELVGLKKAYDAYAKNPEVAMLSVHVDTDAQKLRTLTKDEAAPWPQVLVKLGGDDVSPAYLSGPAMIYVIDPEGVVAAKVLKAENTEIAIAKAILERH
jgi:RNA polymerase sigma factor (sigma-70 family)